MSRTLTPTGSNPKTFPAGTDLSSVIQVYASGGNYVVVDESDSLISPIVDANVTGMPTNNYTIDNLYDTSGRAWKNLYSLTTTPFTVNRNMIGINVGPNWSTLNLAKVGFVRIIDANLQWEDIEQSAGSYDATKLAALDSLVNAAYAAGVDVVYCVQRGNTARSRAASDLTAANKKLWLPGTTGTVGTPGIASNASLTSFINMMLSRYGAKIGYYEGWNEPIVTNSYLDSSGMSGLISFNDAIYDAITTYNTANSTAIKMIGITNTGWEGIDSGTYKNSSINAASGFAKCHIYGYHIYKGGGVNQFSTPLDFVRRVQAEQSSEGKSALPLWITEFGSSSVQKDFGSYQDWVRLFLYWFGLGVARASPYSWDNAGISDMRVSQISQPFYDAFDYLNGKTISWVNVVRGKQIAASINGTAVLI